MPARPAAGALANDPPSFFSPRGMRVLLALSLALAACQPASDPADTPAPDAPPEPAPSGDTIPEAFLGAWDEDAAVCEDGSSMSRFTVTPDGIDWFGGTGDVTAVREGADRVEVDLAYVMEGSPTGREPRTTELRLDDAGRLSLGLGGGRDGLVRCDASGTPDAAAGATVQSVYTTIADCDTIETFEEGEGSVRRCPGYRGTPLFLTEGDLRVDVDAGVRNDGFATPGPFNAVRETVEWRLRDGDPFAVIVRYDLDEGAGGAQRSELAVIRVGTERAPGCLVGYVGADAEPDQNTAARRLADQEAATFDCES